MPAPSAPRLIDLHHLDRERVIGSWLVGDVIVDPGPSTCLNTLLTALDGRVPRALALTHIHLDHAGATGPLVRRFPELQVWVHERGAPHLIDPSRLVASATRLYGADMERLWGEVCGVPAQCVHALGERGDVGPFEYAYTPGHASHHVAYRHRDSGIVFCGDVGGVRIGRGLVLPPTPPPDIDLAAWRRSLDVLVDWRASALCPTHFGRHDDVDAHLQMLRTELDAVEQMARDLDDAAFVASLRARIRAAADAGTAEAYDQAMPPDQCFAGLVRYLRRSPEA